MKHPCRYLIFFRKHEWIWTNNFLFFGVRKCKRCGKVEIHF